MALFKQSNNLKNSANIPFAPKKLPFFYGWVLVAVGTIGVIFSIPGQTMGVSVFTDYLIDSLKLTRDQLSFAYMLGTIGSSLLLTKAGQLYDKFGARSVMIVATLSLAFAITMASLSPQIKALIPESEYIGAIIIMTVIFFMMRFSGQGVMTVVSKNMIMKWFDQRRGLANALSSPAISYGFAASPVFLAMIINEYGWQGAWRFMALILIAFAVVVFIFYRDLPEQCDLIPDGKKLKPKTVANKDFETRKQYTLSEARGTLAYWGVTLTTAFNAFFATGLTFHIVSVFDSLGYSAEKAISIFIPASIISIALAFGGSFLSDFVRLKYLLFLLVGGEIIASLGLTYLEYDWAFYALIIGNGVMGGMFNVLTSVAFPRFFGRKNLGAISGSNYSFIVFSSAIAPIIFSLSKTLSGNYTIAGYISLAIAVGLLLLSLKVKNPQE